MAGTLHEVGQELTSPVGGAILGGTLAVGFASLIEAPLGATLGSWTSIVVGGVIFLAGTFLMHSHEFLKATIMGFGGVEALTGVFRLVIPTYYK